MCKIITMSRSKHHSTCAACELLQRFP